VVALPAPPVFLTPKGLEHVGPRAFGYDIDFKSVFGAAPHPNPLPAIPGSSPGRERGRSGAPEVPRPAGGEREGPAAKPWEGEGH
jgi:hypothetical protein